MKKLEVNYEITEKIEKNILRKKETTYKVLKIALKN